jgi:RNA polymerase-binding transcription factor DksA
MSEPLRFDDAARARLRKKLLGRGQVIATKLSELLAGKDGRSLISMLGLDAKPGMRPEEVLRAALDHVEKLRKQIEAGDDAYGRCWACGKDVGLAGLEEVPWADACGEHAGMVR